MRYLGEATGFIEEYCGRLCLHDEKTDFRLFFSIESSDMISGIKTCNERVCLTFEPLHMRRARVKPLQIERLPEEYKPISFTAPFFTEYLEGADRLDEGSYLKGVFLHDDNERPIDVGIGSIHEAHLYSAFYDDYSKAKADVIVGRFTIHSDWHVELMYALKDIRYAFSLEEWDELQKKTALCLPFVKNESEAQKTRRKPISSRLRYEVLLRDKHRCVDCGASAIEDPLVRLEVDHRLPVSKGGTNNLDNLQTLCWACNNGKSSNIDHKLNVSDLSLDPWSHVA